ncbi:MAG: MFS transporter [Planctomycetota bacterium]|nr:MAG: MFS transporter [Planctomycetota bacterium]
MQDSTGNLKYWQQRIFASVWVTYFAYYLCRYNMTIAKKPLCDTFSWSNESIGIIFSALLLMYAVGQFVNGQLADRFGTRIIASLGILGSVVMNLAVFFVLLVAVPESSNPRTLLWLIVLFWGANGFFQAMGWSPMVRVMTHWFPLSSRGNVMGILGTCYQFGGAFSWLLADFLTGYYVQEFDGDWRVVFLVPAVLFAIVGIFFYLLIRNCPEDVGLPPVDSVDNPQPEVGRESQRTIFENVVVILKSPYLWIVAFTFFFLDMNRYGFVNWLPAYLKEQGGDEVVGITANFKEWMKLCIHPLAGSAGAILAGWATDRFFGGRRAPVIAILLVLLAISSMVFPYVVLAGAGTWLIVLVVSVIGFCTYGPHILMVGHAAQDFGKKEGAAGAAGFIDAMGYIGAALAGWGAGRLIDMYDYTITFITFGSAALLGALFICLIWKVNPNQQH